MKKFFAPSGKNVKSEDNYAAIYTVNKLHKINTTNNNQ